MEFSYSTETLISLIEKHTHLWDKTVDIYKNREATREAWHTILSNIYPKSSTWDPKKRAKYVQMLITKWAHIRDSYLRSERKIANQRMSSGRKKNKMSRPYIYHKHLEFLKKNPPYSNLNNINEVFVATDNNDDSKDEDSSCQSVASMNENTSIKMEFDDIPLPVRQAQVNDTVEHSKPSVLVRQPSPIRQSTADMTSQDANMVHVMSFPTQVCTNRHISFFNGLVPTLDKFDDDQVIEFQLGVLKVMKDVKKKTI